MKTRPEGRLLFFAAGGLGSVRCGGWFETVVLPGLPSLAGMTRSTVIAG